VGGLTISVSLPARLSVLRDDLVDVGEIGAAKNSIAERRKL
jgi:hypothetical protein